MRQHDFRRRLPFCDNSVYHILCSHFLEHVIRDECSEILLDFNRVLKRGGKLHVIVPDIVIQVQKYLSRRIAGEKGAADAFIKEILLTTESRGSLKYRVLGGAVVSVSGITGCMMMSRLLR
jgi:predicted SAM-dependent methyltransferase